MVCSRQLTQFQADWVTIQVEGNRFLCVTDLPERFEALRDLVISTFALMHHTPLNALGINYDCHALLANDEEYQTLGDLVAPKAPWDDLLPHPLLAHVKMTSERDDGLAGAINVSGAPSRKFEPFGVHCSVNQHIELNSDSSNLTDILNQRWDRLLADSKRIALGILQKGKSE
jgi:hypothetical protein